MTFASEVKKHTEEYRKRIRIVARESVQETVEMAQKSIYKGGRMRVDTGFLRASVQGGIDQMPSGPVVNELGRSFRDGEQIAGEPVSVTLLKWEPADQVLFIGWTANYARHREYQDGFLRGATELWGKTVDKVAKKHRDAAR